MFVSQLMFSAGEADERSTSPPQSLVTLIICCDGIAAPIDVSRCLHL